MNLSLVIELTILVLAVFLGIEVISKVPAMLHTPLMSGHELIHGIVIVGAIIVLGEADDTFARWSASSPMVLATANVVGGLVRHRPHAPDVQEAPEPKKETGRRDRRDLASSNLIGLLYLVTIVCFILALRSSRRPKHARRGNWIGGVGMILAIVGTLLHRRDRQLGPDRHRRRDRRRLSALVGARTVKMTAMPQMVALFNGVGGGAAALVALAEFHIRAGGGLGDDASSRPSCRR